MYLDEYKRWLAADLEDADLKPELAKVEGNDDEIKDRFAVALKFGTAGLRGVLGAGTNRMNIYVVRQATQGLANWVLTQGGTQTVAISYDSRLKSDVFAKTAAGVLAANGIKVRIYDALMPVPALSFATRYYNCNAGIMVTASHNPAKYNGYKAYGPDGCQMTDDAAAIVYDEIQKTDVLTGAKYISFAEGVENGMIRFVGDDCKKALYDAIEARQVRPGLCKTAGLKLVYSPLNGSGLVPVTHVLNDMGITDITIVPEQEYPNGYFTTCSYPNPEIFEALKLGLELATKTGADSLKLARRVAQILKEHGWRIENIDATLLCQRPKLAPHIPAMRANLAAAFGLPVEAVRVKATTEEHLGFTGEGLGIAAHAVALIEAV